MNKINNKLKVKVIVLSKSKFVKSDLFNNYHLNYMAARLAERCVERIEEVSN